MARKGIILIGAALAASAAFVFARTRHAERSNPPLGKFVEVDGVKLHYLERGSGVPLVLLHGNGSMVQDFLTSGLVDLAAHKYRVIVFDRPGYGWSERPRARLWTPAEQAELLAKAAQRLGASRAHLFGHSWGTMVAIEWALRQPESVAGLTLASGYYYPGARIDALLISGNALPVWGDLLRATVTPIIGRLIWPVILRKLFGPSPIPRHFRKFPRSFALSPLSLRASSEEAALMVPSARQLAGRYPELKLPVSIIAGDGDRIVNTRSQSERLHSDIPGSRLQILPGVGHMVHHIEPQTTMRSLLDDKEATRQAA